MSKPVDPAGITAEATEETRVEEFVVIRIPKRDAKPIQNFIEYATRKNQKWTSQDRTGVYLADQTGQDEVRRLAAALSPLTYGYDVYEDED